jgi:hypothetical protein
LTDLRFDAFSTPVRRRFSWLNATTVPGLAAGAPRNAQFQDIRRKFRLGGKIALFLFFARTVTEV